MHASPDIIMMIQWMKMRWIVHVTRMGGMKNAQKSWSENLKERDQVKERH